MKPTPKLPFHFLVKPFIKTKSIFSTVNQYCKQFGNLAQEKGSIGKAYQTCRQVYKTSGPYAVKALLCPRPQPQNGFIILTAKHTHYIAKLFTHSLKKVGIESSIIFDVPQNGYENDKWHIVICPQMFETMPAHYIAFQMEQSVSSRWFTDAYFQKLHRAAHVFDYSLTNIAFLQERQLPFKQLHYLPIGIETSQATQTNQDFEYDVAFYGDPNSERRKLFLKKLSEQFSVKVISEVFGEKSHDLLKKAKIVVNIHDYENALLETARIYECLSLNKLIVSEQGSDQPEHTDLNNIVDFVDIGNIDTMIKQIDYWLNHKEAFSTRLQEISDFRQQPDKFQFYLYRFLLSQDIIDFETFYNLCNDYIKPKGDFWCLSLPESVLRSRDFDQDNHYGIWKFPGLRHNTGWIGCGLSYKFMMRIAEKSGMPHVSICEDDVFFNQEFAQRYAEIKQTLNHAETDWDIYSGLIADLSEETEITASPIQGGNESFYQINRLVSMVFNIYHQRAYSKIYTWNEQNRHTQNTIDRYIEQHGGICGLITSPFLVGHKEEQFSTLWGKQNTIYKDMIARSQALLDKKISELENQT
ncbi:hypothetical protein L4G92_00450 [Neisseria sp. ZJ106]|uniref:Uncharacterized protein n=1 Tax=Neisseria lisongii TaxID=2912188 RepID=A0ABY7RJ95_9NEIS|nr:hypothetical protein [Neisseria lisongii]MCF7520528.1 hypothetical protein [Neisseria lisongii]WCL71533.1 hypothetical protein PJU73_09480 [Neisseria lisongii]